ncbi:hypothetical protein EDC96DRAFT_198818 [Choanephora cucurbitarum]|nr:hypothetical protein EDC96DRAFT_198818 [Choanephora cucurbitarum]
MVQHHRVYVRCIKEAFCPSPFSLVRSYLLDYISRSLTKGTYSGLSCFYTDLRIRSSLDYGHFMHQLYLAFNLYYDEDVRQVVCNLPTFLRLPLTACFQELSEDHWILQEHHRPLLTFDFFCIDRNRRSFRLLGASDQPRFPQSLGRLDKGLRDYSIRIHPRLRDAIELFLDHTDDFNTTVLAASLRPSVHWTDLTSDLFTFWLRLKLLPVEPTGLSSAQLLRLWSLLLNPSCRTFWFRVFYNKFHCQATIALFRPDMSSACAFYSMPSKSRSHLLFECSTKWAI